jgi:acyl dehydratase
MKASKWRLEELVVGTEARFERHIDKSDVDMFAHLSGDYNPLHMDPKYALSSGFRDRVVHGAFLVALASRFIGMELPGQYSFLLSFKLDFVAPTFPGDTIEVVGRVQSIHLEQRVVVLRLKMSCCGEIRARGSAMVRLDK